MFSEFKSLILSEEIKVKETDSETQKILDSIDTSKILDLNETEE
jgi:hypothetical protein